jgi:hypothetical protein
MELVWDFARKIDTAGVGGNTTSYFDTSCQAFYTDGGYIKTQVGNVAFGQWQDTDYGPEVIISNAGYDCLDIEHHYNGSVYGSAKKSESTVFLVYDYMMDLSGWLTEGEWVEQPDNPIKAGSVTIRNADISRMMDANFSIFAPGSRVVLRFRIGDSEYYDIGTFFLTSAPYDELAETFTLSGRNRIGQFLAEQTFDELTSLNTTISMAVKAIMNHAGLSENEYVVEEDEATVQASFEPDQTLMDGLTKLIAVFDWVMDDLPNGDIIVGSRTFVRTYKLTAVYEFTRNTDIVSMPATRSMDGVYTRVCVRREVPARQVYVNVPYYDSWFLGSHKTYHIKVDDNVSDAQMDAMATTVASELQYMGIVEQVYSPFRPWLQIGDVAKLTGGEDERIVGIISNLKHTFGPESGFFTEISVTSGGEISNPDNPAMIASRFAGKLGGANREKRLVDYLQQSSANTGGSVSGYGGGGGEDGLSAYEIWRSLGNTGTEEDFIRSLSGLVTRVSLSTDQDVGIDTWTVLSWDTEVIDDAGAYSSSYPTRITVPTGKTRVCLKAFVPFTADATGIRYAQIRKGTDDNPVNITTALASAESGLMLDSGWLECEAGEYFEVLANAGTSGADVLGANSWGGPAWFEASFL